MRVTREQAERNRQHIVATASVLFRERGVDGIGIADLMKSAGMTHGGFYKNFDSKEALASEACGHAFDEQITQRWCTTLLSTDGKSVPVKRFIEAYLSASHRDNVGEGCPMPALGADAGRHSEVLRHSFGDGFEAMVHQLIPTLSSSGDTLGRDHAVAVLASLLRALVLSRAVEDQRTSMAILQNPTQFLEERL